MSIPLYERRISAINKTIDAIYEKLGYLETPFLDSAFVYDVIIYQARNSFNSTDWFNLLSINF